MNRAPIRFHRRVWVPGLCYGNETAEQAARRDELCMPAELARARPLPHLEAWAAQRGLWKAEPTNA